MTLYRRKLPHLEKPGATYFVTFKTRSGFALPDKAKSLVLEHCLYENGKSCALHCAIVMRTHVHLIFFTPQPNVRLATIMNGIKGASSHNVNGLLNRKGSLWLDESFDHMIRSDAEFDAKVLYIQTNAMETGVSHPEFYPWYWREPAQAGAPVLQRSKRLRDPWLSPASAPRK
ncbi:MAG TPA: transposase [Candidatus Angelobacter sp.]|nr:transposase [Candidatus Angelobacter sp.]